MEPPKKTHPLDFDQRHKLSITADYRFGPEEGPWIWGIYPLARAGFNLLLKTGSGFPYTPTFIFNEVSLAGANSRPQGPINSSKGPWSFQMDLRANKAFRWDRIKADFFVWTINLFNRQNVAAWDRGTGLQSSVYTSTGNAVTTLWLHTEEGRNFIRRFGEQGEGKHLLKELNPMNFSTPRQIRFGMSLGF